MHRLDIVIDKLAKKSFAEEQLFEMLERIDDFSNLDDEIKYEMLQSFGLPIFRKDGFLSLKSKFTKIENETFCIVDIETNGAKPTSYQIIEIAAVKLRNGKIIDKFESLIQSDFIPESIQRLTSITPDDLRNAPPMNVVMEAFKTFLQDSIFIAHSVKFDYNFISATLYKVGFGILLNRKLCTIDLAKRTFKAQKYGLKHLQLHLNLKVKTHHRAYADVLNTAEIFKISLENLPKNIKTTENLIDFSKRGTVLGQPNENIVKDNTQQQNIKKFLPLKIAINGFGRIGRAILRVALKKKNVEIVAINDANHNNIKMADYILKYDSVFGTIDRNIKIEDGFLKIDNRRIKLFNEEKIENLNFADYGAKVVIEATGVHLTRELSKAHLKNGIKKVIYSAPAMDNTPTFVLGVNADKYNGQNIISNGSCTTNCLGPIAKTIDDIFGIKKGVITTIHSYTNDQNLLDENHRRDKRKARSAGLNMIPTTTGAARAMKLIMPNLEGKLHGQSVRVPTPNVSMVDFNVVIEKNSTTQEINHILTQASKAELKKILQMDNDMLVSSDIVGNPHSCIVATDLTQVIDGDLVKIMAWYDNEWGYSNRLLEMAKFIIEPVSII